MKNEILAYLTSTINQYGRIEDAYGKNIIEDLKDFESFVMDLKEDTTDNTLTLNADLRNNARAYQDDLAEKECTITTLATDLYNFGYIEKENKMLEAENLELRSRLAMMSVNERTVRELKSDNQMWQAQCIELRKKLEKATKCQWWID